MWSDDIIKSKCTQTNYDKLCISNSRLKPKEHQKRIVEHMMTHRGLLAIHDVGSGKTLSAVIAGECFLKKYPNRYVIVVTPKSLQNNYLKEMVQYDPNIDKSKYYFFTIDGFSSAMKQNKINCKDSMLILDEAHNLRTHIKLKKGIRASKMIGCTKLASKVLLLTATPIINMRSDMINLISMIDGTDNITRDTFKKILDDDKLFTDYFKCKFSIFSPNIQSTRENYPSTKTKKIFIPMSEEYEYKYTMVEKNVGFEKLFVNPQFFYNGVRRASNMLDGSVTSPKIEWMNNFFKQHQDGKVLIFSHWIDYGLNIISNLLDKLKISYLQISGSLSKKDRKIAVNKYNSSDIRVLIISKAGGEGLDLKLTRYIILVEPSWNIATIQQVIGRGVRYKSHDELPKSKRNVEIYKLYLIKKNEVGNMDKYNDIKNIHKSKIKWSIDLYLRALSIYKNKQINEMIDRLKSLSIEKSKCSC